MKRWSLAHDPAARIFVLPWVLGWTYGTLALRDGAGSVPATVVGIGMLAVGSVALWHLVFIAWTAPSTPVDSQSPRT